MGYQRRSHEQGFTLVELMVVVLIIGILVSVAIPVFKAATNAASRSTCLSNQRMIEGAVPSYISGGGAMWSQTHSLDGGGTADTCDILIPGYISKAPECPQSGLFYLVDATGAVLGDQSDTVGFVVGHEHF